jgi:hypothetical protein
MPVSGSTILPSFYLIPVKKFFEGCLNDNDHEAPMIGTLL